jgi:hypothetical protein
MARAAAGSHDSSGPRSNSHARSLKATEQCRLANAQIKRARQPFDSLYFSIYNERRQAIFARQSWA